MKLGFDIDGVICRKPVVKTPESCLNANWTGLNVPSNSHGVYLVSARSGRVKTETEKCLAENGIEYERLVLYGDPSGWSVRNVFEGLSEREINRKQSEFKAGAINELGLEAFVEDRRAVRDRLEYLCPGCVILSPKKVQPEDFKWKKSFLSKC